eukprot:scaffold19519_cov153-Isochrysis_galbana.AAC.1
MTSPIGCAVLPFPPTRCGGVGPALGAVRAQWERKQQFRILDKTLKSLLLAPFHGLSPTVMVSGRHSFYRLPQVHRAPASTPLPPPPSPVLHHVRPAR